MEKVTLLMKWKLKTESVKIADAMMRKMLKTLTVEELELIGDCKITKTLESVNLEAKENGEVGPN